MANEKSDFWNQFVRIKVIRKLFEEYKGDTDKLSAKELEMYHLTNFEEHLYRSGFLSFYEAGGAFFQEVIDILDKIKAFKCIELLQQGYTLIQPYLQEDGNLPDNYLDLFSYNDSIYEDLRKLDEALWQNPENLDVLCYEYYILEAIAEYHHAQFVFLITTKSEYHCEGFLEWDEKTQKRFENIELLNEDTSESWYLDENGFRLEDEKLFENSPWVIVENGDKQKAILRFFDKKIGEVRFSLLPWEKISHLTK